MAVLEVIKRYREMVKKNRWRVILAIIVLVILIWTGYVMLGRYPDWTGFGDKTLWDWMQLLIIPVILAVGAYRLNESARKQEIKIASENRQETALQTYLDKMTELLLDKKLCESEVGEVIAVARARTLTVLRRLDGVPKGELLIFLYEANLISKYKTVINLAEADLRRADLYGANLSEANLSETFLDGANLRFADLCRANMTKAGLSWADLKWTKLRGVNLSNAVLIRADLSLTDLRGANLSNAVLDSTNLTLAKLSEVNLSGAEYNQNTIWPDNFDPVAAGAICSSEEITKKAWWQFWKK